MTTTMPVRLELSSETRSGLTRGTWPKGMSPTLAVPLAARCARQFSEQQIGLGTLATMSEKRDALIRRLAKTPGIEEDTRKAIRLSVASFDHEIYVRTTALRTGMPILDASFLSWKGRDQLPVFAVYDLDSPVARITLNRLSNIEMSGRRGGGPIAPQGFTLEPNLPAFMESRYLDTRAQVNIESMAEERNAGIIQLTARYNGSMPDEVCEAIDLARKKKMFKRIFIVTQAPEWEVNATPRIQIGDPLVIGVNDDEIISLIATYDLTPTEQLVKQLCMNGSAAEIRSSN